MPANLRTLLLTQIGEQAYLGWDGTSQGIFKDENALQTLDGRVARDCDRTGKPETKS